MDDFTAYAGVENPLGGQVGAIVRLRSGSLAIVPPRETDEYDLDTEVIWFQTGDANDIVAYRALPISMGDKLLRMISRYLSFTDGLAADPVTDHPFNRQLLAKIRRELDDTISEYKFKWPDDPALEGMARLRHWGDEDDAE